jgi:hypothetical protein
MRHPFLSLGWNVFPNSDYRLRENIPNIIDLDQGAVDLVPRKNDGNRSYEN